MDTPQQAVGELRYAVTELGAKSVLLAGNAVGRSPPAGTASTCSASTATTTTTRSGRRAWSSAWRPWCTRRCSTPRHPVGLELRVQPHRGLAGNHSRCARPCSSAACTVASPSCASGSSRAAWRGRARCSPTLVGHWRSGRPRHRRARSRAPRRRRRALAGRALRRRPDEGQPRPHRRVPRPRPGRPAQLDEFAAAGVDRGRGPPGAVRAAHFFGCEADDPLVASPSASTWRGRRPGSARCSAPTCRTGTRR